jgi:hypothetical protein
MRCSKRGPAITVPSKGQPGRVPWLVVGLSKFKASASSRVCRGEPYSVAKVAGLEASPQSLRLRELHNRHR